MTSQRKRGGGLAAITAAVAIVSMLYVLGVGPMGWLVSHGYVRADVAEWIYYPISELAGVLHLEGPLTWYVRLFWSGQDA
jgi:hypothetical protein